MKKIFLIPILLFLYAIGNCQSHRVKATPLKRFKDGKTAYFIDYDATRRGSVLEIDYGTGDIKFISEPPPDVALTLTKELSAKANIAEKVNAELQYKTIQSIAQLGQRTAAVNILRDAMYKLSELKLNHKTIDDTTYKLFDKILQTALEFSRVEKEIQENEKERNIKEAKEKELEILKLQNKPIDIDKATLYEKNGFDAILNKNLDLAIFSFEKSDAAYPTFHSVYEISRYLRKVRDNENITNWDKIKKDILSKYSWGMSSDIKDKFKP